MGVRETLASMRALLLGHRPELDRKTDELLEALEKGGRAAERMERAAEHVHDRDDTFRRFVHGVRGAKHSADIESGRSED